MTSLGHEATRVGTQMNLRRIKATVNWEPPKNVIGRGSFDKIKQVPVQTPAPVLAPPQGAGGYEVNSDASYQDLGCVLMQHGRVIAYASR